MHPQLNTRVFRMCMHTLLKNKSQKRSKGVCNTEVGLLETAKQNPWTERDSLTIQIALL